MWGAFRESNTYPQVLAARLVRFYRRTYYPHTCMLPCFITSALIRSYVCILRKVKYQFQRAYSSEVVLMFHEFCWYQIKWQFLGIPTTLTEFENIKHLTTSMAALQILKFILIQPLFSLHPEISNKYTYSFLLRIIPSCFSNWDEELHRKGGSPPGWSCYYPLRW